MELKTPSLKEVSFPDLWSPLPFLLEATLATTSTTHPNLSCIVGNVGTSFVKYVWNKKDDICGSPASNLYPVLSVVSLTMLSECNAKSVAYSFNFTRSKFEFSSALVYGKTPAKLMTFPPASAVFHPVC